MTTLFSGWCNSQLNLAQEEDLGSLRGAHVVGAALVLLLLRRAVLRVATVMQRVAKSAFGCDG